MGKVYGYARISTAKQSIDRQIKNLENYDKKIDIFKEVFTGRSIARPQWAKLQKKVRDGDTIVFDSVSRMSRNSEEGVKKYFELMEKGIELVFIKEPYINTSVYDEKLKTNESITVEDKDLNDTIMRGVREYLVKLAEKQIIIAFDQSEKEVEDLRQRTVEGLEQAVKKGKVLGRAPGTKVNLKREKELKKKLNKHSKAFGGSMTDKEFIETYRCSKSTLVKYKRELREEKEEYIKKQL